MMDRRTFLACASVLLAAPVAVHAQQAGRVRLIAYLAAGGRPPDGAPPAALRQALRELGYIEGQNVGYAGRWGEGKRDRLHGAAEELIALKPDVIVTFGAKSAEAVKALTPTIPVVFAYAGDPVRLGLIASLAHPGGNLTGITDQATELSAKRLELLREVVPTAKRVAVLWNADDQAMSLRYGEIEKAAQVLHVSLQPLGVREPDDFDLAISAMSRDRPDALLFVTDALTTLNRRRIVEFAAANGIPTMYEIGFLVRDGGLMSYGPDYDDILRRAAIYVDRILKGVRPSDLPVEQPTRYYLLVNLRTAKALDLTIPGPLLLRADAVIQ